MSTLPKDSIRTISESIGVPGLSNDICTSLGADLEYRLREVLEEARSFMIHSKRNTLTTKDVNDALRLKNVQPLHGFSSGDPIRFHRAVGTKALFYYKDYEVDLDKLVDAELPEVPRDVAMTAHWLAVEGVQPAIPQNPVNKILREEAKRTESVEGGNVKPLVKHVLTKELQLYYEKVTQTIVECMNANDTDDVLQLALDAVRNDAGIQQLLPYFVQFALDFMHENLKDLRRNTITMRFIDSLVRSEHVDVSPYLHQLMPPILTCLVSKHLSASAQDDHWSLRERAARVLGRVCARFGVTYPHLQSRAAKTLIGALLDEKYPLCTQFGALIGLCQLGPYAIRVLVVPNATVCASRYTLDTLDARMCMGALVSAVGLFLRDSKVTVDDLHRVGEQVEEEEERERKSKTRRKRSGDVAAVVDEVAETVDLRVLYETFGDKLLPFVTEKVEEKAADREKEEELRGAAELNGEEKKEKVKEKEKERTGEEKGTEEGNEEEKEKEKVEEDGVVAMETD